MSWYAILSLPIPFKILPLNRIRGDLNEENEQGYVPVLDKQNTLIGWVKKQ